MPLKGIILIFTLAIIFAFVERNKIYEWLTSVFSDDNNTNDDDN